MGLRNAYILANWLGNTWHSTAETTYHEDKVYLPREVREKLGLVDGDVLHIEVEKGVARLSIARGPAATKKILAKLDHPPDLGKVIGRLSREEIYEDIA